MKLRKEIDIQEFLKAVRTCNGEIFYDTKEEDHLNLKSQLSQFIFAIIYSKGYELLSGDVTFIDLNDATILSEFIS